MKPFLRILFWFFLCFGFLFWFRVTGRAEGPVVVKWDGNGQTCGGCPNSEITDQYTGQVIGEEAVACCTPFTNHMQKEFPSFKEAEDFIANCGSGIFGGNCSNVHYYQAEKEIIVGEIVYSSSTEIQASTIAPHIPPACTDAPSGCQDAR